MATDVSICNAALGLIGGGRISSLISGTPSDKEQHCRDQYPIARKYVLRSHPWNCAERKAWLTDPQIDPYDVDLTVEEVYGVKVRGAYLEPSVSGGNIARGTTRTNSGAANYFELELVGAPAVDSAVGVMTATADRVTSIGGQATGWAYLGSGQKQGAMVGPAAYGNAWAKGDRIGVLWNATAASLTFYRNGVSEGVAYASGVTGYLHPTVFVRSAVRVHLQRADWLYAPAGATPWPSAALSNEYEDFSRRLWLPNDCLRVLGVGPKDEVPDYRIIGRELLCDLDAVQFTYTADITEADFDAMLVEAMAVYLAALLAYPIAKSASLRDSLFNQFGNTIAPSRAVDGMEQPLQGPQAETRLINARFGSRW